MKLHNPTLDQEAALASVLRSLRSDFSPTFDNETIETFLTHSYEELAGRANRPTTTSRSLPDGLRASG